MGATPCLRTKLCKFKAKPDQMPLKAGTEFKTTTDKFHLLENKYVDVTDQNLRRFNLLYATMQKDGADSTRLTLTGADSCKFAVLPATAVEWGNANRIAAKGLTYGDLAAAPKKLPFAPDEYIKVDDYDYYAIKVVTYKLVPTLDADDKQVVVNNKPVFHIEDAVYYGYLRVRTMMSLYHQGDTPKFSHVAFDFKYAQERDYTKE